MQKPGVVHLYFNYVMFQTIYAEGQSANGEEQRRPTLSEDFDLLDAYSRTVVNVAGRVSNAVVHLKDKNPSKTAGRRPNPVAAPAAGLL